ncbi:uncharacterized protein DUF3822 [Ulvibacter sp. MAR_2010_11]|uniref:DUF3822 family protein n=1 Tax=Ulvibacter sp. MAR_2010_11 TaxID=1250229 RepID=UPI000C2C319F|nr:DUF3822 family protein [Ulvibacter sp. MAR_2010_11]PKA84269.1 uncharacterized protein DUF3822 [Ulvibacter sp. MAR_2010_11]
METGQKYTTLQKTNNIDPNSNKRLSVQVTLTGLSFLVSVSDTKEIVFYSEKKFSSSSTPEELLVEMETVFSEKKELQTAFETVTLLYATNIYSLVPATLFDDSKASDYLKFNSKILANDFIAHDVIDMYEMVVVYVPFVNINNYLFDRFGSFQYHHACSVLLKSILDAEKHSQEPIVYLHVLDSTFDVIVVKNGGLQLCNTYSYKTPEDFIYYVLFSMEQLHLNPETIKTVLCGAISETDTTYEIVYRYIRNVAFAEKMPVAVHTSHSDSFHSNYLLVKSL